MKTFLELAKARKSIRKYKGDPIPEDALLRILESGRIAPSGNNSQPWKFIVVSNDETKKRLYEVAGRQPWILEAPISIAVVADMTAKLKPEFRHLTPSIDDDKHRDVLIKAVRDATIAADHIVMAATDEGLGTCWIALFEQKDIGPVLRVPDFCYVVALITVGYPAEESPARPRKNMAEVTFTDRYGEGPICAKR